MSGRDNAAVQASAALSDERMIEELALWILCPKLCHQVCTILSWSDEDDCLVGLVVKASTMGAEDPEFDSRWHRGDFFWLSHTRDLKIGTPVATLPGTRHYRISTRTGWPGVGVL